jgi:predicted amidophosphoribosyltransferase
MKRLCPACFTELPENANYCPVCGKCMREVVEQTSEYIGSSPVTTIVGINDCAIHVRNRNATSTNHST